MSPVGTVAVGASDVEGLLDSEGWTGACIVLVEALD